jgi:hypothetical protein
MKGVDEDTCKKWFSDIYMNMSSYYSGERYEDWIEGDCIFFTIGSPANKVGFGEWLSYNGYAVYDGQARMVRKSWDDIWIWLKLTPKAQNLINFYKL